MTTSDERQRLTTISFGEINGIARSNEPVRLGMPLPQGQIRHGSQIEISDDQENLLPLQTKVLAHWPDHSVQWLLLDMLISVGAGAQREFAVWSRPPAVATSSEAATPLPEISSSSLQLNSSQLILQASSAAYAFFDSVTIVHSQRHQQFLSQLVAVDADGRSYVAVIERMNVEAHGAVLSIIAAHGRMVAVGAGCDWRFTSRWYYWHHLDLLRLDFSIHNGNAALHPENLWDLGDPGSVLFRELSLQVTMPGLSTAQAKTISGDRFMPVPGKQWQVLQQSSGGANWRSSNHIAAAGQNYRCLPGASLEIAGVKSALARACPRLAVASEVLTMTVALKEFWQNFPKLLQLEGEQLTIGFFPRQHQEIYELQGGERKTHSVFFHFTTTATPADLDWIDTPLVGVLSAEWYARTRVYPCLPLPGATDHRRYFDIVANAISGNNTFAVRREIIDEYGWRHYGELYADHESAYNEADKPFNSHYNNQYDVIASAFLHFWYSGNPKWQRLGDELARHVRDIDIYHCGKDRYEFNGGMFWHTNHYLDAETATHRCFSCRHPAAASGNYGGGPSPQNAYIQGLIWHYYLSGDELSRQAVLTVLANIKSLVAGPARRSQRWHSWLKQQVKRWLRVLKKSPGAYGLFEGPGRESGNALLALVQGFVFSGERDYLFQAQRLIYRCVSPDDDLARRQLGDVENRWMYVMFLQALAEYLRVKQLYHQQDAAYHYAQATLLHYADWMLTNEKAYLSNPAALEYPNETWAAQELRKSLVFCYAAEHTDDQSRRDAYQHHAGHYYRQCFTDLEPFADRVYLTRPLAILLACGLPCHYFGLPGLAMPTKEPARRE